MMLFPLFHPDLVLLGWAVCPGKLFENEPVDKFQLKCRLLDSAPIDLQRDTCKVGNKLTNYIAYWKITVLKSRFVVWTVLLVWLCYQKAIPDNLIDFQCEIQKLITC